MFKETNLIFIDNISDIDILHLEIKIHLRNKISY